MADTLITTSTAPGQLAPEKKGLVGKISGFVTEVQREMKKVTWPTREQLQDATIVTLSLTLLMSAFIFGVDKIFEVVLRLVYGLS
ncbi:MAG TPA: preprotein translocase subunit SecE [Candidatus Kapabacteria bacterium]|nr:preprotein translocase subunit SecE [Candidatus Kapabacteria bacterium]